MDLISVIVPIYNTEKYLGRCINSIRKQTYRKLQIILVDDGSTDKSGKICEHYKLIDERIEVLHINWGGAGKARNIGLNAAIGEYILFVDADDWIEKDMIQILYEYMMKYKTDISMCDYAVDYGIKRKRVCSSVVKYKMLNQRKMLEYFFRIHGEKSNYSVCAKLLKSDILKGFRFIEGRMNEDVAACYCFFKNAYRCVSINTKKYHYCQNSEGVTLRKFTNKDFDLLYIWDLIISYITEDFPEYIYYAEMNRKRSDFTLLTKMERDYFRGNKELKSLCKKWQVITRRNMLELFRWRMPITRKLLLLIECFILI